jgi:hypothetical protein
VLAFLVSDCDIHLFASEVEDCKQGSVSHVKCSVTIVIEERYLLYYQVKRKKFATNDFLFMLLNNFQLLVIFVLIALSNYDGRWT